MYRNKKEENNRRCLRLAVIYGLIILSLFILWPSSKSEEVEEPQRLYDDALQSEYEDFNVENTLNDDDDKTLEDNLQKVDSIMLPALLRHSGMGNSKLNQKIERLHEILNPKKSLNEEPVNYFYAEQQPQKSRENLRNNEQQDSMEYKIFNTDQKETMDENTEQQDALKNEQQDVKSIESIIMNSKEKLIEFEQLGQSNLKSLKVNSEQEFRIKSIKIISEEIASKEFEKSNLKSDENAEQQAQNETIEKSSEVVRQFENERKKSSEPEKLDEIPETFNPLESEQQNKSSQESTENEQGKLEKTYEALLKDPKFLELMINKLNLKKPLNDEKKSINPLKENLVKFREILAIQNEENVKKSEQQIEENLPKDEENESKKAEETEQQLEENLSKTEEDLANKAEIEKTEQQLEENHPNAVLPQENLEPTASKSVEIIPKLDQAPDLVNDDEFVSIGDPNPQPSQEQTEQKSNDNEEFEDTFRDNSGHVFIE